MFYKISKFENHIRKNDVIMMSLRKTMEKFGPPQTRQIIYHSKGTDKSYPKMYFLLNLSHCVKSYGHFCQILVLFMMTAHQIWSCHVTQDANFEIFLFCPNSKLNIWKRQKISSGKALYFRSYQPKTSQGVENTPPPSAFRVNIIRHYTFFYTRYAFFVVLNYQKHKYLALLSLSKNLTSVFNRQLSLSKSRLSGSFSYKRPIRFFFSNLEPFRSYYSAELEHKKHTLL